MDGHTADAKRRGARRGNAQAPGFSPASMTSPLPAGLFCSPAPPASELLLSPDEALLCSCAVVPALCASLCFAEGADEAPPSVGACQTEITSLEGELLSVLPAAPPFFPEAELFPLPEEAFAAALSPEDSEPPSTEIRETSESIFD